MTAPYLDSFIKMTSLAVAPDVSVAVNLISKFRSPGIVPWKVRVFGLKVSQFGKASRFFVDRTNGDRLSNIPVRAVKCCAVADSVRGIRLAADGDIRHEFPPSLRRDSTGLRDSAESIASRMSGQNPELRLSLRT